MLTRCELGDISFFDIAMGLNGEHMHMREPSEHELKAIERESEAQGELEALLTEAARMWLPQRDALRVRSMPVDRLHALKDIINIADAWRRVEEARIELVNGNTNTRGE